jgi:ubiquinone/menaquinone biosynthesis C-methylase UbiE
MDEEIETTHSYEGLARKYFRVRRGTPGFAAFVISHAGLEKNRSRRPLTIVELGVGAGQQTEYVEAELNAAGLSRYVILACDKSSGPGSDGEPAQLDLLMDRIDSGEISDRVCPIRYDFDGRPLPLESESVDLAYMAWVLHHLKEQQGVINEIARVTRKGSGFFMYQVTIEDLVNHPLDRYFPSKYEYDAQRYPTRVQLKRMFLDAGFTFETSYLIRKDDPKPMDRVFLESIENTTFDSALRIIKDNDPDAFAMGVDRVRREVERYESTGKYRTYFHNRRKIFWGTKR